MNNKISENNPKTKILYIKAQKSTLNLTKITNLKSQKVNRNAQLNI